MEERQNQGKGRLSTLVRNIASRFSCRKPTHQCTPARYEETGEVLRFYWEVPWCFTQEF